MQADISTDIKSTQLSPEQLDSVWSFIMAEAEHATAQHPELAHFFYATILSHESFAVAISHYLADRLGQRAMPSDVLQTLFQEMFTSQPSLILAMLGDLLAHYHRDAACDQYMTPLLYFKGFHAIQSYRIAHALWCQGRHTLAIYLQHRAAEIFDVDIHPAARLGTGLMLDHATGVVIGETAVVEDDVSMMHAVTLGGSGAQSGKRHPVVRRGVLLSAGAKLLGAIELGEGVKVGAGSVVLEDVPPHFTVAGVPAKPVGLARVAMPSLEMDHSIDEGADDE